MISSARRVQFPKSRRILSHPSKSNYSRIPKDSQRPAPDKWNYNAAYFLDSPDVDYASFDRITANDLESHQAPPRRVKMLFRDFIEDSLYNPNYGYFPKQATIFETPDASFKFQNLRDSTEFQEEVAKCYAAYGTERTDGPGRQLWHTPTELFKPWYGQAVAQCIVSEYLLKYFPYEDFIIYEIGAGNGTLALDILNYIREKYPGVYERTRYNIIEISSNLIKLQENKLYNAHSCVNVIHKSIFHWDIREPAPCFFVAMEVIDNFAHDVIRYDLRTLEPYQGLVSIDEQGDFAAYYTQVTDPLISFFLDLRRQLFHPPPISKLLKRSSTLRQVYTSLPFAPNLSTPEYIPTRLLNLIQILRDHFPRHRLLLSDFSSLPDTIPGVSAPVVQTRYQNMTVPCTTLLVRQGFFDILFPTNFENLRDMYEHMLLQPADPSSIPIRSSPLMTNASSLSLGMDFFSSRLPSTRRTPLDGVASASGLPVGERKSNVFTHAEFLQTYADLSKTQLQNGENPMLDFYQNVKFLF